MSLKCAWPPSFNILMNNYRISWFDFHNSFTYSFCTLFCVYKWLKQNKKGKEVDSSKTNLYTLD